MHMLQKLIVYSIYEVVNKHIFQSGENELPTNPVMVEDPEVETRWYIRHFLGRG